MQQAISFPPLLKGHAVAGDPLTAAVEAARAGIDPGAVFYGSDPAAMEVALVLAPEEPLATALRVSFAVSLGLNDALGALAPPEVAVHLGWPDRIKVNGALCGGLTALASTDDGTAEPDWLVVGLRLAYVRPGVDEPGHDPEHTALGEEGCADILLPDLIEAWARHMMNWLHIYMTEGFEPLHREWRGKGDGMGGAVNHPEAGTFLGLDEHGGMILKTGDATRIIPLTTMLEAR